MKSGKATGPSGRGGLTRTGAAPVSHEKEYESCLLGVPAFFLWDKSVGGAWRRGKLVVSSKYPEVTFRGKVSCGYMEVS